jgi:O-antigen/teichoic acid export membrane protein
LSIYRSIVKQSGAYGLSVMAGRIFSILLLPVYTRYLHPADYGIIEMLDVTIAVVGSMIGVRLADSLLYFYAEAATEDEKKTVASTTVLSAFLLGLGAVGLVIGALCSGVTSRVIFGSSSYAGLFQLAFLNLGLGIVVDTTWSYYRATGQAGRYALLTTIRVLLMGGFNVLLIVAARMGVRGFLWGTAVGTLLPIAYVTTQILSRTGIRFDRQLFRREIRYATPLMFTGLAMMCLHSGDRFFLRSYVSLADIGIYALAYKMGTMVSTVQTAFSLYWSAQLFHVLKRPDGDRISVRLMTYVTGGLMAIGLAICLFIGPILRVLAASDFRGAAVYVPPIILAYVIRGAGDHVRGVFSLCNRPAKHLHVTSVGAAACLAAYALLIPALHLWGAAWGTLVGFVAMTAASIYWGQKLRRYDFEYGRMMRLLVYSAAALAPLELIRPQSFWPQVGLGVLLFAAWTAAVLFTGLLQADEREKLAALIGSIRAALGPKREAAKSARAAI